MRVKMLGRRRQTDGTPRPAITMLPVPRGTEWGWRCDVLSAPLPKPELIAPGSGMPLQTGLAIWHDGNADALCVRQIAAAPAGDQPPFALKTDIDGFSGSFLSFSQDLPPEALRDLTRSHIIRLYLALSSDASVVCYARLNIGHGPNTEQMLHRLAEPHPEPPGPQVVEFDLAYTNMSEKRLNKIWLDLIFEAPVINEITLHDMVMSRHFRAEM